MSDGGEAARRAHARAMEHFDALCDRPLEEQELELALLRDEDPEVARLVEGMLGADQRGGPLLAGEAVVALVSDAAATPRTGAHDGPRWPARFDPEALLGTLLGGRYRAVSLVGSGGFGHVFRAHGPGGEVAVKLLHHGAPDARAEERFRREFLAISRLDHPGCLRVHELGSHEGAPFLVMDYVAGGDLRRLVGAPLPRLLPVLLRLCDALAHVHERGIVHRDLKPANVLCATDEAGAIQPLLCDFGIAKTQDGLASLSSQGKLVGSIDYVAPEQVEGRSLDARSDLFALGCMIHELCTGELPFAGSPFERLAARLEASPRPLPLLDAAAPPELVLLVSRLLARHPAARPSSARDVSEALAAVPAR